MTEVEVKIRLPSRQAYEQTAAVLASNKTAEYEQENYFFDGANKELSSKRIVARVRLYNVDQKAELTIKGKAIVENGIGRASEVEEEIPVPLAREALIKPDVLLLSSSLFDTLKEQFGLTSLVPLGGFRNKRIVYPWQGNVIELDETTYEHGTLYELECETATPEVLRDQIEQLLGSNGIEYSYSQTTKFANFINKTLV